MKIPGNLIAIKKIKFQRIGSLVVLGIPAVYLWLYALGIVPFLIDVNKGGPEFKDMFLILKYISPILLTLMLVFYLVLSGKVLKQLQNKL